MHCLWNHPNHLNNNNNINSDLQGNTIKSSSIIIVASNGNTTTTSTSTTTSSHKKKRPRTLSFTSVLNTNNNNYYYYYCYFNNNNNCNPPPIHNTIIIIIIICENRNGDCRVEHCQSQLHKELILLLQVPLTVNFNKNQLPTLPNWKKSQTLVQLRSTIRIYHSGGGGGGSRSSFLIISLMIFMSMAVIPKTVLAWSTTGSTMMISSRILKYGKSSTTTWNCGTSSQKCNWMGCSNVNISQQQQQSPPSSWIQLHMSLDSRELRFYHRGDRNSISEKKFDDTLSSSTTSSSASTTTTTYTAASNALEYTKRRSSSSMSSRDIASNNHHYHNSVIVPNYLSHIFPTSLLETQYKMIESITPVVVTAMSAVASAIRTTSTVPSTTAGSTTTTMTSTKLVDRAPSISYDNASWSRGSESLGTNQHISVMEQATLLEASRKRNDNDSNLDRPKLKKTVTINRFNSTLALSTSVQQHQLNLRRPRPPQSGYGPSIQLTTEEQELFNLLRHVRNQIGLTTTLRVAGGWVRDKLLATPEFQTYHRIFTVGSQSQQYQQSSTSSLDPSKQRISSKFRRNRNVFHNPSNPSIGRQGTKVLISNSSNKGNNVADAFQPVDIDIALDDMLGREFADHLNDYLSKNGQDTVTVGMVLKNPDKSKHLETATMKVNTFWIDFVNLRAEEYTQDSRIPDLMRIGTPHEDAFRRDLTINSLFYNINTGQVEDWTGRGFQDLRKGVVSTPLHPLTTLLDDPLRVLRSIRFAARLRFTMDEELVKAAQMSSVADALSQKVSRERVGGELDLMLRSPDPVGAIRLLINLKQVQCVFPVAKYYKDIIVQQLKRKDVPTEQMDRAIAHAMGNIFRAGLLLLSTAHDHLADCLWSPPVWCINQKRVYGATEVRLIDDEDGRRLLWYASFLKPMYDEFKRITPSTDGAGTTTANSSKRSSLKHKSIVMKMLVDELKRPIRDAESIERIIKTADEFTQLMESGMDVSATMILLSDVSVSYTSDNDDAAGSCGGRLVCSMNGRLVDSNVEDDPVWMHAMEFRLSCAKVLLHIGSLWRASLFLSISEELVRAEQENNGGIEYTIEGDILHETQEERRQGIMERFDSFAAALQQIGLIGIWDEKPIADGDTIMKDILPGLPKGPMFRNVMDEQWNWMIQHPGAEIDALTKHLQIVFEPYAKARPPLISKEE